jgi:hypothetical protein
MREYFINFRDMNVRMSIGACVLAAAIGSTPARSDALPDKTMNDAAASKNNAALPISGTASADAPPRQHVKHLRAHKKMSVDPSTASTQSPDKPQNAQSSGTKAEPAVADKKVAAEGAASSAATQAVARTRIKTVRPRRDTAAKTQPRSSAGSRTVRQRDFFSDLFGGDD